MSKQLREMLNQLTQKKAQAKVLVSENKVEEAKAAMSEIKELQAKAEMLAELEDDEDEEVEDKITNKQMKEIKDKKDVSIVNAFVNALRTVIPGNKLSKEDHEVLNQMSEGIPADGGLTVPKDIQTQIKELRRSEDALENLVNVETVSTLAGSRVVEVNADMVPFDNVDEAAQFPDVATPKFENIEYKVKKKGGILKVTRELLQDTSENIIAYLRRWIAKKAKLTRNMMILSELATTFGTEKAVVDGLDAIKKIFNVKLDPAISMGASVLTNQDGFNWLDTLKDTDGKYVLQPNPVDATKRLLFGKYPVYVVTNKTLKTTLNKAPIYFGDFKQAITIFDRETLSIEMSDQAGDLWGKDLTGIKVRERLDIKSIDKGAIVTGEITVTP